MISGDQEGVDAGMAAAKEAGAKKVVPLNVSGAFHSPLMAPAEDGLRAHLEGLTFHDARRPVFSNVTTRPVTDGNESRELLVRQLTSPVRWSASIREMIAAGAERFVELGEGSVLCGLNKRNAKGMPCQAIGTPAAVEAFRATGEDA